MNKLNKFVKKFEPNKESKFLHTVYDGFYTFLFVPDHVTKGGVHIKDRMDLKRLMTIVVISLQLCFLLGTYNIGHQHFLAVGQHEGLFEGMHLKLFFGLGKLLPIYIVSMIVGLGIEFWYAAKRGHPIEEGYLVSGALIPLIMPPDVSLLILTLSIVFAVIIGKEAFGGTGMNVWNIALLSRVFVFFAYPTTISGDEVWVAGLSSTTAGSLVDYGWWEMGLSNWIFGLFDMIPFDAGLAVIDGYTGATPLSLAASGGWQAVTDVYTTSDMWWGWIPGSIGETSKPFIIVGALFLIFTRVASWRIMLSMFVGAIFMTLIFNWIGTSEFMAVPWQYQFYMGSFFFAMAFMATDPVTASSTNKGKLIYGFLIGMIGMIIRVWNPAYPEGWMLAILLINTFAPLIDHYILQSNINKRLKRV
jgi:Na+-transporting NADH:ubiquinone oxidoreductase subunit B